MRGIDGVWWTAIADILRPTRQPQPQIKEEKNQIRVEKEGKPT
jgi:hypothetical protein